MEEKKGIFVESNHLILPKKLPEDIYAQAMSSMIVVCADIAIFCPKSKALYLAKRIVSPMRGYWTIGGRRLAGEAGTEAARRNLLRETGVDVEEACFSMATSIEVIWSDRKEDPRTQGKHDIIQFYAVMLSDEEIKHANENLIQSEYERRSLRRFNQEELIAYNVSPIIHKVYQAIFPSRKF